MNLNHLTIGCLAIAAAVVSLLAPGLATAQDVDARIVSREYQMKAAYLLHFTSFIGWPYNALEDDIIEIGILGQDPFGNALETIEGKTVQGRRIVIRRSADAKVLESCAVLFVSRSEQFRLPDVLSTIAGRPILTVSEIEGFASQFGIIGFATSGNRLGFEVNTEAAKRSHLRVSSRLLRVATVVSDSRATTGHSVIHSRLLYAKLDPRPASVFELNASHK